MINFNIDYIVNHKPLHRQPVNRYNPQNLNACVTIIANLHKRHNNIIAIKSFARIKASRKAKVQRFVCLQAILNRKIQTAFQDIRNFSLKSSVKSGIKSDKKYSYPLQLLARSIGSLKFGKMELAWHKLANNLQKTRRKNIGLQSYIRIAKQYQRKMLTADFFTKIKAKTLIKTRACYQNLLKLQMLWDRMRIKNIFDSFSAVSIASAIKQIKQSQEQRGIMRQSAKKEDIKKRTIVGQFNKKIKQLQGQVRQKQIQNAATKNQGSKETGLRINRKRQQQKQIENKKTEAEQELQTLASEVQRRTQFIESRTHTGKPFNKLFAIYIQIDQGQSNQKTWNSIVKKIPNVDLQNYQKHVNYHIMENISLQDQIHLYEERIPVASKANFYIQLDIENSCLKGMVQSLLEMQLMDHRKEEMMASVDTINQSLKGLKKQLPVVEHRSPKPLKRY